MTGQEQRKPFTLRERRGVLVPLGIWAFVSALATLTGPFETYQLLPLMPRLAYWALVAAVGQVQKVTKRDGCLCLTMRDGAEIPVNRSYKPAVKAAGLTA